MAVSSANRTTEPPTTEVDAAMKQLGEAVAIYLDGGPGGTTPSTIVDVTGPRPRLLREGALTLAELREVAPTIEQVG
jgi:tRNA A37 threonylcarbamoyladenosine synthetase subunit TsaC/SUA5/YrdC